MSEFPPKSRHPFEHAFIDLLYLDANRKAFNLLLAYYWKGFHAPLSAGKAKRTNRYQH